MIELCGTYVLRCKNYTKGDRYSFHEYTIYNHEQTGKLLTPPESSYERLKYAETFDSLEEAIETKNLVDPEDKLLDIVYLRIAEDEY